MGLLARCGDGVLIAEGERWTFGRQPGSGGNTLLFVLGLVGVIATANGIVLLATGLAAGGIPLAIGALLLLAAYAVLRRRRRARADVQVLPIVVLDFGAGVLCGPDGRELAPLDRVSFAPQFQLASSARKLACSWPGGELTVLRGDAFGGSIGPAIDALRARGLRV